MYDFPPLMKIKYSKASIGAGFGIGRPPPPTALRFRAMMADDQSPKEKLHFHYNHTDACRFSRWAAKECYQFMYARPWQKVNDFYSELVKGSISLSELFRKETRAIHDDAEIIEDDYKSEFVRVSADSSTGRWARVTFKIVLSYHGSSFDGWQKQPGLNTVQGLVEQALGKFVDEKKAQQLKERNLPVEGCSVVAGRTDKGVSAFNQFGLVSLDTWRKDVEAQDIKDAINGVEPEKIRVLSVKKVSREFHPNFSAKWRRYVYIFPMTNVQDNNTVSQPKGSTDCDGDAFNVIKDCMGDISNFNDDEMEIGSKPTSFQVSKVNQLLNQLEGKLISYKMFARDTKASRSCGPPTECFVFHARASEASIPSEDENCTKIMCVELVANRFLRKMVRVLVATAIREAAAGAEDDALLKLVDATCRRATAPPAPPDGLCLVDVGYTDFDRGLCLIA